MICLGALALTCAIAPAATAQAQKGKDDSASASAIDRGDGDAGKKGRQAPPDREIAAAVTRELLFDPVVPANDLDVEAVGGIVTLTGDTSNVIEQRRAARVAETVRGVRAVVNRVEVHPPDDRIGDRLRRDVEDALLLDPATDEYEVSVAIRDRHHVDLEGAVDSWSERRLCEQVASDVAGVTGVTNRIRVRNDGDRSDGEIRAEILRTIDWDVLLTNALIDVTVVDGLVTLSGVVGSAAEKRVARAAAWTMGVTSVDASDLRVEAWARPEHRRVSRWVERSDAEIRSAVEDALFLDPRVRGFAVETAVSDGSVTLSGVVDNLKARRAAERDARDTVGVNSVYNLLKVRPTESVMAAEVEEDVRGALRRDPFVDPDGITIEGLDDGGVRLEGSVDSYFEKSRAGDLASRVVGVTDVLNRLVVLDPLMLPTSPFVDDFALVRDGWYERPWTLTQRPDREIERTIESELWWSPFVGAEDVEVHVEDGIATLSGVVDDRLEADAAQENAYEGGAIFVRDRLEIGPDDRSGDADS